jgi:nickel-dependent lactate racemase
LDFERGGRKDGVGTGLLDGNAMSEACDRVATLINPAFSITTIVNDQGHAEKIFAGHWRTSHRRACHEYLSTHSQNISEKRDVVIVSCGGAPYDINLIQAHKALEMAAHACADGGTIVFIAKCADGLGRDDFMKWFDSKNSRALENRLRDKYEVNGQTAWALMTKAERFRVQIITNLDSGHCGRMRLNPVHSINEALADTAARGYILPRGAGLLPVASQSKTA